MFKGVRKGSKQSMADRNGWKRKGLQKREKRRDNVSSVSLVGTKVIAFSGVASGNPPSLKHLKH